MSDLRTTHHAERHVEILLYPMEEEVVGCHLDPVLSHLLFQGRQQWLEFFLTV